VAIYHLSVKPVSRGEGRSATSAAAYRSATRITDRRTGDVFDYTRKRGVEHTEIVLPTRADSPVADWARDREALWNLAEAMERRKDARVARDLASRYGVAVDFAIHKPHRQGDDRNHHAHILTTTRAVSADGLGAKTAVELGDRDRAKLGLGRGAEEVIAIRERWAELTNAALERARSEERVDHRNLADQGLDRAPTSHLGPVVTERQRRGKDSNVLERIAREREQDANVRLANAAEAGKLERETPELEKAIIDTETSLKKALELRDLKTPRREREQVITNAKLTPEEARQLAQRRWLEGREAFLQGRERAADSRPKSLDLDLGL
jgi:hypothetical protein